MTITITVSILIVIYLGLLIYIKRSGNQLVSRYHAHEVQNYSPWAKYIGVKSKGHAQWRGNCILVLTRNHIHFERIAPRKCLSIPLNQVSHVEITSSFSGKNIYRSLLLVSYTDEQGDSETIAWYVKNPQKWRNQINSLSYQARQMV